MSEIVRPCCWICVPKCSPPETQVGLGELWTHWAQIGAKFGHLGPCQGIWGSWGQLRLSGGHVEAKLGDVMLKPYVRLCSAMFLVLRPEMLSLQQDQDFKWVSFELCLFRLGPGKATLWLRWCHLGANYVGAVLKAITLPPGPEGETESNQKPSKTQKLRQNPPSKCSPQWPSSLNFFSRQAGRRASPSRAKWDDDVFAKVTSSKARAPLARPAPTERCGRIFGPASFFLKLPVRAEKRSALTHSDIYRHPYGISSCTVTCFASAGAMLDNPMALLCHLRLTSIPHNFGCASVLSKLPKLVRG